jgi:hypothetical protein
MVDASRLPSGSAQLRRLWLSSRQDPSILSLTRDLALSQGFSSNLSGGTAADPSRSVLPERAIIQSVDVVRGAVRPQQYRVPGKGSGMGRLQEPPVTVIALAYQERNALQAFFCCSLRPFHLLPTDQVTEWSSKPKWANVLSPPIRKYSILGKKYPPEPFAVQMLPGSGIQTSHTSKALRSNKAAVKPSQKRQPAPQFE